MLKNFGGAGGIVYILPEVKSLEAVFHLAGADVASGSSAPRAN